MTLHTPQRTYNTALVSYGSGASGKILLLDPSDPNTASTYTNTTWVWNGSNGAGDWTQISANTTIDPVGPLGPAINGVKLSGRVGQAMAYDGTYVMLYGGNGASETAGIFQDTWLYNTVSNSWSLATVNTQPYGRTGAKAAYLAGTGAILFGGSLANGQLLNETWQWVSTSATTGTWTQISVANGAGPSVRVGHVMASSSSKVVLFGGKNSNSQLNDTWVYTAAGGWVNQNIPSALSPSVRDGAQMCYDSVNNVFVLYSGGNATLGFLPEVWTLNAAATTWTKVTASGAIPPSKIAGAMAFDTVSGLSILFSGITSAARGYSGNLTFGFNAATSTWTQF